jgi:hypothetical protein
MKNTLIQALAVLRDTWGCVYPGCGAVFSSHVELEGHMASHY